MERDKFTKARTWIELSEKNLRHNMGVFRRLSGKAARIWVVKANAYGHGLNEIGSLIKKNLRVGEWLAVDSVDEALVLRRSRVGCPIIVLGWVPPARMREIVLNNLRLLVSSAETINALARVKGKRLVRVHLKIDTGTTRQGVLPQNVPLLAALIRRKGIILEGCATHFANIEDDENVSYGDMQIDRFIHAVTTLKAMGFALPIVHAACSAATMVRPETLFTAVRVGIGLYGLNPSPLIEKNFRRREKISLKPVLAWRSKIALVKTVPAGTFVGYGLTHRTKRKTVIAIVPVGYFDGYGRGLSSNSMVIINKKRCPVIGRICMNMMVVDATSCINIKEGDCVTLIGNDGRSSITADELAEKSSTINYEIVARIAGHHPRFLV